jgi:3'-phosphoadenosine 5'-phosphosulfate sulfotransferase (PAPS reductase)/FAD synthetase
MVIQQPDLFRAARALDEIAVDERIAAALADLDAIVIFNLSGGKDSCAAAKATSLYLDLVGHPRELRFAIHADLGRAEWKSTPGLVERTAAALGVELIVVRRRAGDMVARFATRWTNGKARYERLETYNLIGPWAQANKRFCTAEMKAQVIGPELARRFRGRRIIQIVGIRRQESDGRKNAPIAKLDDRFAKPGNRHGTEMLLWNPIVEWPVEDVFDCHARHGLELHEAYTVYGSSRLSCAYCVLASLKDLQAAASAAGNLDLFLEYVSMEADSTFSFQPERWLGDVAPALLSPGLAADLERAKIDAARRRAIEEAMPAGLRYVDGWPIRVPTQDEAASIVVARREILVRHRLEELYPTARLVIDRFQELMDLNGTKRRAKEDRAERRAIRASPDSADRPREERMKEGRK